MLKEKAYGACDKCGCSHEECECEATEEVTFLPDFSCVVPE